MRSHAGVAATVCACALAAVAAPARADACSGIVSPCIDDDTLWPHGGPSRFVAIGSSETLGAGRTGFALVTSYLSRPVVLASAAPGANGGGSAQDVVDNQVNGTFLWSYGVTRRLEVDLALPITFVQSGTGLAPVTGGAGLKDTAVRDMRFGFAYTLVPQRAAAEGEVAWGLAARFETSAPTGDSSELAGERTAVFVPSLAADARLGRAFAGVEAGARIRPITELLDARIGTQIVAAAGVGYDVLPRDLLSVALEGWALPTLAVQQRVEVVGGAYVGVHDGRHIVPAEWQLSLRSAPVHGGDLSFQLGGGGGLPLGGDLPVTTPRFRFTLGMRWAPR